MQNSKFYLFLLVQTAILIAVHAKALIDGHNLSTPANAQALIELARGVAKEYEESKQFLPLAAGKETNTPDFVRLVVMRLIYGIASTMGIEDRLETLFNGIFTPPNADSDIFGFGGFGDGDGDEGEDALIGDLFDV